VSAIAGPGAGQITLTWQPPGSDGGSPVTGYRIYRGNETASIAFLTSVGNVLTYTDSGLGNNAVRYYKVSAINAAGEGLRAAWVSATTFTVPTAPQSLLASPGVRQVQLSWQSPSNTGGTAVTAYKVYRVTGLGKETLVASVGNVLSYKDTGLANGTAYTYRVQAVNLAGTGPYSQAASATTWSAPSVPTSTAAEAKVNAVRLTWHPPAVDGGTPVTGYNIFRGLQPGPDTLLASVGNVLSYEDTTAHNGTRYYYRLASVNAVGQGIVTNRLTARPYALLLQTGPVPIPPSGPMATVTVCDSGSQQGCQTPGQAYLCVQMSLANGTAVPLACVDHATVPPDVAVMLKSVSPVQITAPPQQTFASVPSIEVLYQHEHSKLVPWDTKPICAPIATNTPSATWYAGAGADTALTVRIIGTGPTGQPLPLPHQSPTWGKSSRRHRQCGGSSLAAEWANDESHAGTACAELGRLPLRAPFMQRLLGAKRRPHGSRAERRVQVGRPERKRGPSARRAPLPHSNKHPLGFI